MAVGMVCGLTVAASTAALALTPVSVGSVGEWSPASTLAGCSAAGAPRVVFPKDSPTQSTGAGAIVWGSGGGCKEAGVAAGAWVAAIGAGDVPGMAEPARTAAGGRLALGPPVAAVEGPHGKILLAGAAGGGASGGGVGDGGGASGGGAAGERLVVSEGNAGGGFSDERTTGGPAWPVGLASGYLGDVAIGALVPAAGASPRGSGKSFQNGGPARARAHARGAAISNTSPATEEALESTPDEEALEMWVHRYYQGGFQTGTRIGRAARGSVEGLTVALDYRSDGLAVWAQGGAVYGRSLPASDRSSQPLQRVAGTAGKTAIAALLSDDNRGIVAWSVTAQGVTSVYGELTGPQVRFRAGGGRLLERFRDPHGQAPPAYAGPRLIRLASESVMLAWTGVGRGTDGDRWAVHATAVDLNGVGSSETISPAGRDGLLAGLAAGPADDGFALIYEPAETAGGADLKEGGLYGARGGDEHPDRTRFGAVEEIAGAGPEGTNGEAGIGVDPDSDRAIAAWRTPAGGVESSVRELAEG